MNADGSNPLNLSAYEDARQSDSSPAWSPDGKMIAWAGGVGESNLLIRKPYDPYDVMTVPRIGFQNPRGPAWSPDSKKIVFAAADTTVFPFIMHLYLYDLVTKTVTRISSGSGDSSPNWSPDGAKILFVRTSGGFSDIWMMNPDGSNQQKITTNEQDDAPKWSLDVKQIAFSSQDSQSSFGLYIMNSDGTNRKKIRSGSMSFAEFDWQRQPLSLTMPAGTGISVNSGLVNLNFTNVSNGGTTTVIPIDPNSAGTMPGGFVISQASIAFDIATTASYTAPVTVCFNVPRVAGQTSAQFFAPKVLHGEKDANDQPILVDRTISHDFASRSICASVSSLSPFLVAADQNAQSNINEIDDSRTFVRRHYLDFLDREPDQSGWDYWTGQIVQCGSDATCIHNKRVGVSGAFLFEQEYQQTGCYVIRLYRAAYGNNQPLANADTSNTTEASKLPSYAAYFSDRAEVIGAATLAQAQLALADDFVQRAEFLARYPASLDGPSFVDAVLATLRNDIGVDLGSQRDALIGLFNSGGRGAVTYRLADDNAQTNPINNRAFIDAEYNRAFVTTQYFGYLRRDADIGGLLFWLGQVNSAPLRDTTKQHAMVCSFITSAEYQNRFSAMVTHTNAECPQ